MSLIFAETFDHSGLEILSPQMTISKIHKRMYEGQKLTQILFDLEIEHYTLEEFLK